MELRSVIKKNAKKALSGFWGQSVAIVLLCIGCALMLLILETLLLDYLSLPPYIDLHNTDSNPFDDLANASPASFALLFSGWILSFIIGTPISYGARRWFYLRSGGASPDFAEVFFYFSSLPSCIGSLWIQFNLWMRQLFWSTVFLAPGGACVLLGFWAGGSATGSNEQMLTTGLIVSGSIITTCAAAMLAVFLQRFALMRCLYFEIDGITVREAVRLSVRGSRGHRAEILALYLSFIGWFALCLVGLPVLFVLPYFLMCRSILVRLLITDADLTGQHDKMRREQERILEEERHANDQQMGSSSPI